MRRMANRAGRPKPVNARVLRAHSTRYNCAMNTLYYGDCLTIMEDKLAAASVDLIYLDPPFNSKRDYNAIYKDETGRPLPDQVEAFKDTWRLDAERARAIRELPKRMAEHRINGPAAKSGQILHGKIAGRLQQLPEFLKRRPARREPMTKP